MGILPLCEGPGVELRLSGLTTRAFLTHWSILSAVLYFPERRTSCAAWSCVCASIRDLVGDCVSVFKLLSHGDLTFFSLHVPNDGRVVIQYLWIKYSTNMGLIHY